MIGYTLFIQSFKIVFSASNVKYTSHIFCGQIRLYILVFFFNVIRLKFVKIRSNTNSHLIDDSPYRTATIFRCESCHHRSSVNISFTRNFEVYVYIYIYVQKVDKKIKFAIDKHLAPR